MCAHAHMETHTHTCAFNVCRNNICKLGMGCANLVSAVTCILSSLLCTHGTCGSEESARTIWLVFSLGGCGLLLIDLCIILAKTLFVLPR